MGLNASLCVLIGLYKSLQVPMRPYLSSWVRMCPYGLGLEIWVVHLPLETCAT